MYIYIYLNFSISKNAVRSIKAAACTGGQCLVANATGRQRDTPTGAAPLPDGARPGPLLFEGATPGSSTG